MQTEIYAALIGAAAALAVVYLANLLQRDHDKRKNLRAVLSLLIFVRWELTELRKHLTLGLPRSQHIEGIELVITEGHLGLLPPNIAQRLLQIRGTTTDCDRIIEYRRRCATAKNQGSPEESLVPVIEVGLTVNHKLLDKMAEEAIAKIEDYQKHLGSWKGILFPVWCLPESLKSPKVVIVVGHSPTVQVGLPGSSEDS